MLKKKKKRQKYIWHLTEELPDYHIWETVFQPKIWLHPFLLSEVLKLVPSEEESH